MESANTSDFVICGFTPGERDGLGALVLGTNDEGSLKWAGNVGTGFDAAMVRTLQKKLDSLITTRPRRFLPLKTSLRK